MRANMLTLVDFADATFRAVSTEIERPRAVGSNRNPVRMAAMGREGASRPGYQAFDCTTRDLVTSSRRFCRRRRSSSVSISSDVGDRVAVDEQQTGERPFAVIGFTKAKSASSVRVCCGLRIQATMPTCIVR